MAPLLKTQAQHHCVNLSIRRLVKAKQRGDNEKATASPIIVRCCIDFLTYAHTAVQVAVYKQTGLVACDSH